MFRLSPHEVLAWNPLPAVSGGDGERSSARASRRRERAARRGALPL